MKTIHKERLTKVRPKSRIVKPFEIKIRQGQAPCKKIESKWNPIQIKCEMPRAIKFKGQEPCILKSIDLNQKAQPVILELGARIRSLRK